MKNTEWDSNADTVRYASKAYDTLCEILNPEGLNILDFGCGTGLLTERLAPAASRIVGLDASEKMISVLNRKQLGNIDALAVELTQETIQSNPSLQRQFDLIVASSVCSFLPDYESTLQLLKTLLKPKGVFVQWDWLNTGGASGFGLSKEAVESAFVNAGLEVASITQAFTLESKQGSMPVLMGVAKKT
ncbi:MAG: class I SAM-dependent methyltransferase [Amphritea sp.]